jgi:hypothetical protein
MRVALARCVAACKERRRLAWRVRHITLFEENVSRHVQPEIDCPSSLSSIVTQQAHIALRRVVAIVPARRIPFDESAVLDSGCASPTNMFLYRQPRRHGSR